MRFFSVYSTLMTESEINSHRHWKFDDFIPIATLAGVFVAFYFPLLSGSHTLFNGDFLSMAFPWKFIVYKALHENYLPFWNPSIFSGIPLMEAMHPGALYPPNIIFLLNDYVYAINLFFVLHHGFLTFTTYFLCRYWKMSNPASLSAAFISLFGGFFISILDVYNHFTSLTWLPLIFLLFNKLLDTKKIKYLAGTVSCLTCQTLAGSPEYSALTVILLAGYYLFAVSQKDIQLSIPKRIAAIATMVIITLGISAIQLVPSYLLVKDSPRGQGLSFKLHSVWSMEPRSFWKLIGPDNFSGFLTRGIDIPFNFIQSFYNGILPCLLFLLAFRYWTDRKIRIWIIFFFIGAFFAIGRLNPVYEFLYQIIPLLSMFRFPEKYFFLCQFSLIFISGFLIDRFLKESHNLKNTFFWLSFLSITVVASIKYHPGVNWKIPVSILAVFGLIIFLSTIKKSGKTFIPYAFPALILLDTFLGNAPMLPMIEANFLKDKAAVLKKININSQNPYRIYSSPVKMDFNRPIIPIAPNLLIAYQLTKDYALPNLGTAFGLEYPDGWSTMFLEDSRKWAAQFISASIQKRKLILQRSNVKYWISYVDFTGKGKQISLLGKPNVKEFRETLPRAFLVSDIKILEGKKLFDVYYDPNFDPLKEAILNEKIDCPPSQTFSGKVESIKYKGNQVQIKTEQSGDGFLILLDSWSPGWKATIDGEGSPIYRANYFYRAVPLKSGKHVTKFTYEPQGWKTGWMISSGFILIFVSTLFILRIKGIKQIQ